MASRLRHAQKHVPRVVPYNASREPRLSSNNRLRSSQYLIRGSVRGVKEKRLLRIGGLELANDVIAKVITDSPIGKPSHDWAVVQFQMIPFNDRKSSHSQHLLQSAFNPHRKPLILSLSSTISCDLRPIHKYTPLSTILKITPPTTQPSNCSPQLSAARSSPPCARASRSPSQ